MSSAIASIYDALAATTVAVDGDNATVYDADELPNGIQTAHLPARLLTPLDTFRAENVNSSTVFAAQAGSGFYRLAWQISDMLYHKPISQTAGVRAVGKELLEYMADYADMLSDTSRLSLPEDCVVTNARMHADVLEYPLGSGHWFYGVRVELTLTEDICG